jgi:hypothetical protein
VSKLLRIGIPILILLLMLVVVSAGVAFAKNQDTPISMRTVAADTSYTNSGWGYCTGNCGWNGDSTGNYPPCHGYWR